MFELSCDLSSVESRSAQWSPDQLNITLASQIATPNTVPPKLQIFASFATFCSNPLRFSSVRGFDPHSVS